MTAVALGAVGLLAAALGELRWLVVGYVLATIGATAGALGWRAFNLRRAITGRQSAAQRRLGGLALAVALLAALVNSVLIGIEAAT